MESQEDINQNRFKALIDGTTTEIPKFWFGNKKRKNQTGKRTFCVSMCNSRKSITQSSQDSSNHRTAAFEDYVFFDSYKEANESGFKPCKRCNGRMPPKLVYIAMKYIALVGACKGQEVRFKYIPYILYRWLDYDCSKYHLNREFKKWQVRMEVEPCTYKKWVTSVLDSKEDFTNEIKEYEEMLRLQSIDLYSEKLHSILESLQCRKRKGSNSSNGNSNSETSEENEMVQLEYLQSSNGGTQSEADNSIYNGQATSDSFDFVKLDYSNLRPNQSYCNELQSSLIESNSYPEPDSQSKSHIDNQQKLEIFDSINQEEIIFNIYDDLPLFDELRYIQFSNIQHELEDDKEQ